MQHHDHDEHAPGDGGSGPVGAPAVAVADAEAALVEHYPHLVRLAYLVLPAEMGRHRRVLAAHRAVQRALPRGARRRRSRAVPSSGPRGGAADRAYGEVRAAVLRGALRQARQAPRAGRAGEARRRGRRLRPGLPLVWGLRLFPSAAGPEEAALDRELANLSPGGRAAFVLRHLEGLSEPDVRALLHAAGDADAQAACAAAHRLGRERDGASALLASAEFDSHAVQTRPTDLLRRRALARTAMLAAGALLLALVAVPLTGDGTSGPGTEPVAGPAAPGREGPVGARIAPAELRRTPAEYWADTSRVDFGAWPARGDRTGDAALLGRALDAWAVAGAGDKGSGTGEDGDVRVAVTPGTSAAAPPDPPQLLFAGEVEGAAVVLLHDGRRLARYTEGPDASRPMLTIARADDADVTTAAAVVVHRTATSLRYLTAPWIAGTATLDLLDPDGAPERLARSEAGVTGSLPVPRAGGCTRRPVLWLRSSERIVESHAFLVTDLGEVTPAHLTYTPPPESGQPARAPREAVSAEARRVWARGACALGDLRDSGVRAVYNWEFGRQELPRGAGRAAWVCRRTDTWAGRASVSVRFLPPAREVSDPGREVAVAEDTALCSRFGQHLVARTTWRAPDDEPYLLVAGSREVTGLRVTGEVRAARDGRYLAVPLDGDDTPSGTRVTARLTDGTTLRPLP
ncbi:hypothetical protein RM572_16320 [Streptomyces sp. DSM 42041]|uniref:DNA-directed RNA polymerase specialized sigma24 family protein n=1 Tax=Streptomyces hazeniae TaxID=3075538 RepID=A0ABU2NUC4_9ACTN|nr:hypothetical protein [Streptomyces sp. DSM 42041]MDT0380320.1 hypothetical protein [Streptomyces sp. DSM 42041]